MKEFTKDEMRDTKALNRLYGLLVGGLFFIDSVIIMANIVNPVAVSYTHLTLPTILLV